MADLSIIVPIYNGEKYLKKCIDSVLAQTYTDFELILVDDGSTDGSLDICREYEQKDDRVVVFHKENAGLVAARKSGLSLAKGKYIGFVDCDDYIDDDMYSNLMEVAENDGSDIVAGGMLVDFGDRKYPKYHSVSAGYYDKARIVSEIFPIMLVRTGFGGLGIIPAVWLKVFKAEVLKNALPNVSDSIAIGEDVAITAYSMANAESLSIVQSASYHYVQVDGSMVRSFNPKRLETIRNLYGCLTAVKNEDYKRQVPTYISWLIFGAIAECIQRSGYEKKEMKDYIRKILENSISKKCLKEADMSKLSFKDKTKIFLMKNKMIGVLVYLIRG